jgi:hypothetical protein
MADFGYLTRTLAQLMRFERHDITMQDIVAILEAYSKETGLGLGED